MALRLDPFQDIKSVKFGSAEHYIFVGGVNFIQKITVDPSTYSATDGKELYPDTGDYTFDAIAADKNYVFPVYTDDEKILIEKRKASDLSLIDSTTTTDPLGERPGVNTAVEEGSGVFFNLYRGWCRVDKETLSVSNHDPDIANLFGTYWVDAYDGKVYSLSVSQVDFGERQIHVTEADADTGDMNDYYTYDFSYGNPWGIAAGNVGVYALSDDSNYDIHYKLIYEPTKSVIEASFADDIHYPCRGSENYFYWTIGERLIAFDKSWSQVDSTELLVDVGVVRVLEQNGSDIVIQFDNSYIYFYEVKEGRFELIKRSKPPLDWFDGYYIYDMDVVPG